MFTQKTRLKTSIYTWNIYQHISQHPSNVPDMALRILPEPEIGHFFGEPNDTTEVNIET